MVERPTPTGPSRRGWIVLLVLLAAAFVGLRGVHALAEEPDPSQIFTPKVVVVGVTGRTELTAADRQLLSDHLGDAQAGTVSIRPRYVGDCAAAGWTTLGAGRRAAVGGLCEPAVSEGRVVDWSARQAAAAARNGDAQLGTLAGSVTGCVGAVGPGAALAAARPDGTVAAYQTAEAFVAGGFTTTCPITLVDAGERSDAVAAAVAADPDSTLILTGIGPPTGADDPDLQVVYRLQTTLPGWLTSASTRREGIVTLTDLTRTLVDFGRDRQSAPAAVDGTPLAVYPDTLSVPGIADRISAVAALSDAVVVGYLAFGGGAVLPFVVLVTALIRRRWSLARPILTFGTVIPAAMMLTGAVPWADAGSPELAVSLTVWAWSALLTGAAVLVARLFRVPAAVAGAALTVAAFTADAALGGVMQPGSLLNSRPIYGLRWYGFGNVTFAAYATAGLVLAGFVAHRLLAVGRRTAALVAVGAIGFGVMVCEGWPSMGTDFGGVIALTPAVVGLLLTLSGVRITLPRLLALGGSAVVAIAAISALDWRRGPDRRSHLGNFVQRILDGDAYDVVSRKAVASAETIVSPMGVVSLVIGIALWVAILRWALPRLEPSFTTLRPTLLAVLATAILGTLLNDGGASVWLTATSAISVTVAWFWVDLMARARTRAAAAAPRR